MSLGRGEGKEHYVEGMHADRHVAKPFMYEVVTAAKVASTKDEYHGVRARVYRHPAACQARMLGATRIR